MVVVAVVAVVTVVTVVTVVVVVVTAGGGGAVEAGNNTVRERRVCSSRVVSLVELIKIDHMTV